MAREKLILDRYKPIRKLGEGGYGSVELAFDTVIQRKVAIKIIPLSDAELFRTQLPGGPRGVPADENGDYLSDEFIEQDESDINLAGKSISLVAQKEYSTSAFDKDPIASKLRPWGTGFSPWRKQKQEENNNDLLLEEIPEEDFTKVLAKIPGLDEARTAATFNDPRIVTIYDVVIQDHDAYLIMEYVEGITLTQFLRRYGEYFTLDMAAAVFDAVAGALEVAHSKGVLHLDIKPDNVIINTEGQAKVADFGMATLADAAGNGTAGGGTIGYMPLEQMRRAPLDVRSDEWALASLTYEMVAGENPFIASDLALAQKRIEDAELILPSLCWDSLDSGFDDAIFYALDPIPDNRYDSVEDFASEIRKFLGDSEQGVKELGIVVRDALGIEEDEEEINDVFAEETDFETNVSSEKLSLRERLTPGKISILMRLGSAACTVFIFWLSLINTLPLININPSMLDAALWGGVALGVVCGLISPIVGSLAVVIAFTSMLVVIGQYAIAVSFGALSLLWWAFFARKNKAASLIGMSMPFVGALGGASFVPLVSGLSLKPIQAVVTVMYATVWAVLLGSYGTDTILGWNVVTYWNMEYKGIISLIEDMIVAPTTWVIVGSWVAAALVESLFRLRPTRTFNLIGLVLGGAIIAAGLAGAVYINPSWASSNLMLGVLSLILSLAVLVVVVLFAMPVDERDM